MELGKQKTHLKINLLCIFGQEHRELSLHINSLTSIHTIQKIRYKMELCSTKDGG